MQAMAQIHALLRGLVGTDEDLADAASGIPARAMDLLRSYLELLIQANAYSTVVVDGQEARFRNIGEIERGLIRIRRENLVAVERVLKGQFVGILPEARTFEFFAEGIDHVVRGKLASGVPAGILRKRLDETMSIRIIETRVRSGRPRYSVINAPLPGAESGTES